MKTRVGGSSFLQQQLRFIWPLWEDFEQHEADVLLVRCEQQAAGGVFEQHAAEVTRRVARQQQLEGSAAGNASEQVSSQSRKFAGPVILGC